jgi:hypothetical protein
MEGREQMMIVSSGGLAISRVVPLGSVIKERERERERERELTL